MFSLMKILIYFGLILFSLLMQDIVTVQFGFSVHFSWQMWHLKCPRLMRKMIYIRRDGKRWHCRACMSATKHFKMFRSPPLPPHSHFSSRSVEKKIAKWAMTAMEMMERDAMKTVAPCAPVTYHRRVRGDLDDTFPKPCTSPYNPQPLNLYIIIKHLSVFIMRASILRYTNYKFWWTRFAESTSSTRYGAPARNTGA